MRIKTKLNLGVGLLFMMIILLALISSYFIFSLKKDTESILIANYNTLEYSRNMLMALDNIDSDRKEAIADFDINLAKQEGNCTEVNEGKMTAELRGTFKTLQLEIADPSLKGEMRQHIFEIMKLNMDAIKRKSDYAKLTAEDANLYIALSGTLCFLIAFSLLYNLPGNIANPIKELTESIRQIANKNYSERVNFMNHNEFGDLAKSFNTMALKLQEYHNSNLYTLSFEKKRLETLINNMHDPILGLDTNGVILFANNEALKIMALKKEEVVGVLATTLALHNDLLRMLVINQLESDQPHPMKIFYEGKESYFEKESVTITITPTGEETPISIGEVIILRNITIFKELDFAKTNFIATVSHELKTPIASIKLSLQLLENSKIGKLNIEQQELVESIQDDTQRLLKITGELLELSQLETGNIALKTEVTDVYKIVDLAISAVKKEAQQKQIDIVTMAQENLPSVFADSEKTMWVLKNFLSNAIRYSPENSTIEVRLQNENGQMEFRVVDKGKGIENRFKSKVFDKYFQVPGSHKSGTGLGLAISKEFIIAQNGTIGLESEFGLGSTFYFKLPTATA